MSDLFVVFCFFCLVCQVYDWLNHRCTPTTPVPPDKPERPRTPARMLATIAWLDMDRTIAMARSDWRMADYYRSRMEELRKEHTAALDTHNQAIRDRILRRDT